MITGFFVAMIYIGGVSALEDRGLGFWRALGWPWFLGKMLALASIHSVRKADNNG